MKNEKLSSVFSTQVRAESTGLYILVGWEFQCYGFCYSASFRRSGNCVCVCVGGGRGHWLFIYGLFQHLWRCSYRALIYSTEQISNGFHLNNIQIYILWDTSQYSPMTVDRRFGGIYHLPLHVLRISHARTGISQVASRAKIEATCLSKCSDEFQRTPRCDVA
jgi:hypothetical protein